MSSYIYKIYTRMGSSASLPKSTLDKRKNVLIINPKFDNATSINRRFIELKCSNMFKVEFEQKTKWNTIYLYNDVYTVSNLNTFSSRSTAFRTSVSKAYLQHQKERDNTWIISICPSITPTDFDCLFSVPFAISVASQVMLEELKQYLRKTAFIYADIIAQHDENDIIYEATMEHGYYRIITIEFNMKLNDEKLRYIVENIVNWIYI